MPPTTEIKLQDMGIEITKLEPKPGDVLVVKLADDYDHDAVLGCRDALAPLVPEGVKMIVHSGDLAEISVTTLAELLA